MEPAESTSVRRVPTRQVRARFNDRSIVVYQAYSPAIAHRAVTAGTFVPPFRIGRMTWIKPSFLWMMYRSGWVTKLGQERVLAVTITREGFEWALANSCLSHYDPDVYDNHDVWVQLKQASPVRVQWDPERSLLLKPLDYRTIQVGLAGDAVRRYVQDWILELADITPLANEIHDLVEAGDLTAAASRLPPEQPYPLASDIAALIGSTRPGP